MKKNSLLALANLKFREKEYGEALRLYKDAIKENPLLKDIVEQNVRASKLKISGTSPESRGNDKIIVYTCNFGKYETVKEPLYVDPSVEYILFTDNKLLTSKYWRIVVVEETLKDSRRTSRLPKILAHEYLPPHDVSIYIDSSLEIKVKNLQKLVDECLDGRDIALYEHYKRDCVYDEINFVMNDRDREVVNKELCVKQIEKYRKINYPEKNGLYENAFIIRRNTNLIINLNELWWEEYQAGTERDQFVLMYALHKHSVEPSSIKKGKGFRDNPFVNFYQHKYLNFDQHNNLSNLKYKRKVAVVVHVYYLNSWERIKDKLLKIKQDFLLIITSSYEKCELLKKEVNSVFNNVKYLPVDNVGMDVLPFLKAVEAFDLDQFDAVLKLHTKNEKSPQRKLQGDCILSSLLNEVVIEKVFDKKTKSFSIFPGFFTRLIDDLMYGNGKSYEKISNLILGQGNKFSGRFFSAGTMFWMSGLYLTEIKNNMYAIEKIFDNSNANYSTGGDGTPAHTCERLLGSVVESENLELSYRIDSKNKVYKLINANKSLFLENEIMSADSLDHIDLFHAVDNYANIFSKSEIFDAKYYTKKINNIEKIDFNASQSPAVHAMVYGELLGVDPSESFSINFYKLKNKDVLKARKSAIGHYLASGKKEGRKAYPSYMDVREFLIEFEFISEDDDSIKSQAIGFKVEIKKLLDMIQKTVNNSEYIKVEAYSTFKILLDYIALYYKEYCLLLRLYKNGDFVGFTKKAELFYRNYHGRREAEEVFSVSKLLQKKFSEANLQYDSFWEMLNTGSRSSSVLFEKFPYDESEKFLVNRTVFQTVEPTPQNILSKTNKKICVYTSLYGDRDVLPPILTSTDNIEYICFSDREHNSSDWKVIIVPREYDDDNLNAKRFKILPHKYLRDYDASVFIDANTYCYGVIEELIYTYLFQHNFVMFAHPARDDIYKEVATIIGHRRHRPLEIIKQLETYHGLGLPHKTGMVEGSFIWRTHDNHMVNSFMEEWWSHILKYSKRDQISLGYLMWKNNFRPKILPINIGDSRENIYFKKFPHVKALHNKDNIDNKNKKIFFIYSEKFKKSGSTVMRGFQLYDIVKGRLNNCSFPSVSGVDIVNDSNLKSIKNSFVYLTKGVLSSISQRELIGLKENENLILADFVDAKINNDIIPFVDVLVAASISAYISYKNSFPDKKVSLITHHVDPRVENCCLKKCLKKEKAGYFGEIVNTIKNNEVERMVDFFPIDTSGSKQSEDWIDNISSYKFHYLIRRERKIDGFKPFTKGFTAACANAYPILSFDVHDAKYYLGIYYPFYILSVENKINIELNKIIFNSEGYNERMADFYIRKLRKRSTYSFIENEFERALRDASNS